MKTTITILFIFLFNTINAQQNNISDYTDFIKLINKSKNKYLSGEILLKKNINPIFDTNNYVINQKFLFYNDSSLNFLYNEKIQDKKYDYNVLLIKSGKYIFRINNINKKIFLDSNKTIYDANISNINLMFFNKEYYKKDTANIVINITNDDDSLIKYKIIFNRTTNLGGNIKGIERVYFNKKTELISEVIDSIYLQNGLIVNKTKIKPIKLYNEVNKQIKDSINLYLNEIKEKEITKPKVHINNNNIKKIENFKLLNLNGDTIYSDKINSKYIILDFWYISCYPCLKAIPELVELSNQFKKNKLQILGINLYDDVNKIKQVKNKLNINYTILTKGNALAKKYNFYSFPKILIVETKSLKVIKIYQGYQDGLKKDIIETINNCEKK